MKVKPAIPQTIILDPVNGQRLPVAGGEVPANDYYMRRLRDGDCVPVDDAAKRIDARFAGVRSRTFGAKPAPKSAPTKPAPASTPRPKSSPKS